MTQIFISYSRKDISIVERLARDLKRENFDIWYDLSGLEAGKNWGKEIQSALENSQCLIVVLSPNSLMSRWVEREYLFAESLNLKIIPVLYQPCRLPLWTIDLHYIDMTKGGYKKHLDELLKVLGMPELPVKEKASDQLSLAAPEAVPVSEPLQPKPAMIETNAEKVEEPPDIAAEMAEQPEQTSAAQLEAVTKPKLEPNLQPEAEAVDALPMQKQSKKETARGKHPAGRKIPPSFIAAGGIMLLAVVVLFAGQQYGWFSSVFKPLPSETSEPVIIPAIKNSPQALATKPPATLPAVITPAPTATESYIYPNAELAKAFAEPIRQWVSGIDPDADENFTKQKAYWNRLLYLNSNAINPAPLIRDGVLRLENGEGGFLVNVYEIYYTEREHKVIGNTFVFQYDFKMNESDKGTCMQTAIWGYDQELSSTLCLNQGLEVSFLNQSSGQAPEILNNDAKVTFTEGQWHTLQMIAFDHSLALYLDDSPIYYGSNIDPRGTGVGISLLVNGEWVDMSLGNIRLWDLSTTYAAKPFAEPIRLWVKTTAPDIKEDFSTRKGYWDTMINYWLGGQNFSAGDLPQDGVLKLNTHDTGKQYDIYIDQVATIGSENLIFQFDYLIDITDIDTSIHTTFRNTSNERIDASLNNLNHLTIAKRKEESPSGQLLTLMELGQNKTISSKPMQWHTLQFILSDENFAIYIDDNPAFYKETLDIGTIEQIFISINTQSNMHISLDNILLWKNVNIVSSVDGMELVFVATGKYHFSR